MYLTRSASWTDISSRALVKEASAHEFDSRKATTKPGSRNGQAEEPRLQRSGLGLTTDCQQPVANALAKSGYVVALFDVSSTQLVVDWLGE